METSLTTLLGIQVFFHCLQRLQPLRATTEHSFVYFNHATNNLPLTDTHVFLEEVKEKQSRRRIDCWEWNQPAQRLQSKSSHCIWAQCECQGAETTLHWNTSHTWSANPLNFYIYIRSYNECKKFFKLNWSHQCETSKIKLQQCRIITSLLYEQQKAFFHHRNGNKTHI